MSDRVDTLRTQSSGGGFSSWAPDLFGTIGSLGGAYFMSKGVQQQPTQQYYGSPTTTKNNTMLYVVIAVVVLVVLFIVLRKK